MNFLKVLKEPTIEAIEEMTEQYSLAEIIKKIVETRSIHKDVTLDQVLSVYQYIKELHDIDVLNIFENERDTHPVKVMQIENKNFEEILYRLDMNSPELLKELTPLFNHFNRKEKLFMPLFERKGVYTFGRDVWRQDDLVRSHYKALSNRLKRVGEIDARHITDAIDKLKSSFLDTIEVERVLFLPLCYLLLTEAELAQVQLESETYPASVPYQSNEYKYKKRNLDDHKEIPFGAGYLTLKEANAILNNLPLEITFIDSNGMFKYFNDMTEGKDMMFTRTPLSVGRMVSNCHPPNSVSRVMQLIRDLKNKKKSEEIMWFKKGEQFIYVTYKALFDNEDKYMGVLEYVQDIAPIVNLERNMKKHIDKV